MIKVPRHVFNPPNTLPFSLDDRFLNIDHGLDVSDMKWNQLFEENQKDQSEDLEEGFCYSDDYEHHKESLEDENNSSQLLEHENHCKGQFFIKYR